ncbi:hypothetical protein Tco_1341002 [Tanacetum coccineum]
MSSSFFIPLTECKCQLALMMLTSWTRSNPARRFGVCPNKYRTSHFPSQREELENEVRSREELVVHQVEFADMEGQMQQLMEELKKSLKNAFFWKSYCGSVLGYGLVVVVLVMEWINVLCWF